MRHRLRPPPPRAVLPGAVLALSLLLPLRPARSSEVTLEAVRAPAESLPVRAVTVYSDRALVVRRGDLKLAKGRSRLELPALPPTVDPGSIRVASEHATVLRVEVRREDRAELARTAVVELLDRIDGLHDARAVLRDRLATLEAEQALLQGLRPHSKPDGSRLGPPALLDPGGWRPSLGFLDERSGAIDREARPLQAKLRDVEKELAAATAEAGQLAAGSVGTPGYRVEALLESRGGSAGIEVRYVAAGARWYPAYDLRFAPGGAEVEVQFAGLVSQETGEDWEAALLTLSTAVPATTAALPKLASWKIGEKETFIPTPREKPRNVPSIDVAAAPAGARVTVDGKQPRDGELRARLDQALGGEEAGDLSGKVAKRKSRVSAGKRGFLLEKKSVETKEDENRPDYDDDAASDDRAPAAPPAATPEPAPAMEYEDSSRSVDVLAPAKAAKGFFSGLLASDEDKSAPAFDLREEVSLRGQGGWVPPSYAADLPASLAGGYDFSYPSARPETVKSGGDLRRVALHGARFPARPNVTILPALRRQAYVVADVVNRSDRPLLGGLANLFVGSDLQGQAVLKTTAVGETASLPLGIDEAIQVERTVHPTTAEKGLFFKDDVTTYDVVIELANPRRNAVQAHVVDQVPKGIGEKIEVELVSASPPAKPDELEGFLDWRLELPAGSKKVVRFRYKVTRPRGAKLRQE